MQTRTHQLFHLVALSLLVAVGVTGCASDQPVVESMDAFAPPDDARPWDQQHLSDGAAEETSDTRDGSSPIHDSAWPQDGPGAADKSLPDKSLPDKSLPDLGPLCPLGATPGPSKQVLFTQASSTNDLTLENKVIALVGSATAGSTIRAAMYLFSRTGVAAALVKAKARGVDVKIILDESNQKESPAGSGTWVLWAAVSQLITGLGPSNVVLCNKNTPPNGGGCQGPGINHNKFFLFSSLCNGAKQVVVQSSANLTNPQLQMSNNLVMIRGNTGLYGAYTTYWKDLWAQQAKPSYYWSQYTAGAKVYFFPRASSTSSSKDPSTDTIYSILHNNISCSGGAVVRVAMAHWTTGRSYLVDALKALHAASCDVRVIVGNEPGNASLITYIKSQLPASRVKIKSKIHDKLLLVDAPYGGGARKKYVWTGSHNYTGAALRTNDETLLRLDDAALFSAYLGHWNKLWQ